MDDYSSLGYLLPGQYPNEAPPSDGECYCCLMVPTTKDAD